MALRFTCVISILLHQVGLSLAQTTVTVQQGGVIGKVSIVGPMVHSYLGIPYAEPPLGDLRFKKPAPKAPWSSTLNASEYGPICMQGNARFPMSEDCLTLNVHVPQYQGSSKAVMVWVHGGGFVVGSARELDPVGLALTDVITVSINYRLAMFGFLAVNDDVKGNFGLWDQHLAFRWIKDNIAAFGGDPERITISGESAGAMSVSFHAMSPLSDGLFQRVISQSGIGSQYYSLQHKANISKLSETSKCNSIEPTALMSCLKGKTAQDLLSLSNALGARSWMPNLDNEFIFGFIENSSNFLPNQFGKLDYLMGANSHEGNVFLLESEDDVENGFTEEGFREWVDKTFFGRLDREEIKTAAIQEYTTDLMNTDNITRAKQFVEIAGDVIFTVPTHLNALKHSIANGSGSTFLYYLSVNTCAKILPSVSWLDGAGHGDDLIYLFGLVDFFCPAASPIHRALQSGIITYWTNFAKSGDPNNPTAVSTHWPQYDRTQRQYLDLNENITVQSNLKPRRIAFMNDVVAKLVQLPSAENCKDTSYVTEDLVVETLYGKVKGKREIIQEWSWEMYFGIPYAAPPIGDRRFLPPIPPAMWNGVRNATEFGFSCYGGSVFPGVNLTVHEDCLSLNIYVPGGVNMWKEEKLAVMLFIHGGGYFAGASNEYDGRALSSFGRVIVVTINYRLGIFGFASTGDQNAPGNVGLMDQSLAMRWVKHNIARFGGDPERITIFGESAGAGSVIYHVLSTMSQGLFKRAIAESTWIGAWDLHFIDPGKKNNIDFIRDYADHFNCSSSPARMIKCLRDVNGADIAQFAATLMYLEPTKLFTPTVDREFMPYSPSEMFDLLIKYKDMIKKEDMVDLLMGTNSGEGLTQSIYTLSQINANGSQWSNGLSKEDFGVVMKSTVETVVGKNADVILPLILNAYTNWEMPENPMERLRAFRDMLGDVFYTAGTDLAAQVHATIGGNTYVYRFGHEPSNGHPFLATFGLPSGPIYGVADHGDELAFVFGQPLIGDLIGMNFTARDIEVSRQMIAYWSNFARYGSPNGPTVPVYWPQYEPSDTSYMYIGDETEVRQNLGGSRVQQLKNVVRRLAESKDCSEQPSMSMHRPTDSNITNMMQYILPDFPEVNTRFGRVRGFTLRNSVITGGTDSNMFLGIPYAKPPTGSRRFKKPEPVNAWASTLNATMLPPPCPQQPTGLMQLYGLNRTSEDCLHLSVVVPRGTAANAKKPVVVFVHGGFFLTGSPHELGMDTVSSLGDVITVGFNYRLGMLGFMSTGDDALKGNLGLYDMVAAIKWVKENIAAFGGSPDNITLFGPGSGGLAVLHMMVSPQAKDYFHQAVVMDPPAPVTVDTQANLAEISRNFSAGIGCRQESSAELLECLRSKPADSFVFTGNPSLSRQVFLVPDGDLISTDLISAYTAASSQPKPIIITSTSDYTDYFLQQYLGTRDSMTKEEMESSIDMVIASTFPESKMKDLLKSMVKQQFFSSQMESDKDRLMALRHFYNSAHKYGWLYLVGRGQASAGADVYMYEFSHRPQWTMAPEWVGASFLSDLAYLEGFPFNKVHQAETFTTVTERDQMIAGILMSYMGNFVGTGNPNQGNFPVPVEWPKFKADDPKYLMTGLRFMAMDMRDMTGQEQIRFWHGEGEGPPLLYQVANMQTNTPQVMTSPASATQDATCPPALGSSDFLNSLNLGTKGVEDLVLALIVIASVLGLFLIIAVGYVCVMKSRIGKLKKAAFSTSKTELTKM